jgi:nucleoside 2-deoxyribosyltransferase
MNWYLASKYERREELKGYALQLQKLGHWITSSWLDETFDPKASISTYSPAALSEMAARDVSDIYSCDGLIDFTDNDAELRGGHIFERGFAHGQGKQVIIVGPRKNVFCWLPNIKHYETWEEALEKCVALQTP